MISIFFYLLCSKKIQPMWLAISGKRNYFLPLEWVLSPIIHLLVPTNILVLLIAPLWMSCHLVTVVILRCYRWIRLFITSLPEQLEKHFLVLWKLDKETFLLELATASCVISAQWLHRFLTFAGVTKDNRNNLNYFENNLNAHNQSRERRSHAWCYRIW